MGARRSTGDEGYLLCALGAKPIPSASPLPSFLPPLLSPPSPFLRPLLFSALSLFPSPFPFPPLGAVFSLLVFILIHSLLWTMHILLAG